MKENVKTPAIIVAVVVLVALVVFLGSKAMSTGNLDQGQVQYTPGKPPWQETDPAKQGPGASPGVNGQTTPPPPQGAPGGGPPGMGPPTLNNSGG